MGDLKRKKAFVCPTTHWDREWIMTFGQYRVRLVNLIDNLLEIMDKHQKYTFYLDGQSAVFDDYLEIKPENREKLSGYLKSGRFAAGPWYVLADQFLQSGEATIRNLMLGMAKVRKLGGEPLMIGYVPDSFGSIASLPMILQGFGINSATFGRGRPYWNDDLPNTEFIWKSADGSGVTALNHGYGNAVFMSYPDIWSDIFKKESYNPDHENILGTFMHFAAEQEKRAALSALYVSVGADHMEPRNSLIGIVDYINGHQDKYELVFGTPADYIKYIQNGDGVNSLKTYYGELFGTYKNRIFEGTLTSRIDMKQLNDKCDILLSCELEPLYAITSFAANTKYPHGHLNNLWRQHILNHPHDSICGCNLDQVNRDMVNRSEYILNTGTYLRKDAIHSLTDKIDTSDIYNIDGKAVPLFIINPLGHKRGGHVRSLIRVPKRFNHGAYALYDAKGNYVFSHIRHVTDKKKDLESVYMTSGMLADVISKTADGSEPEDSVFTVLDIDFVADDIPSMGYETYSLLPLPSAKKDGFESDITVAENGMGMENERIKVKFNGNATFDVTDKKSGRCYRGLNYFADREEAGNSYEHFEFDKPDEYNSKKIKAEWKLAEYYEHCAVFETTFDFLLPQNIVEGKRSEIKKPVNIKIQAALYGGLDYLDVKIEMENTCKDHCLRAVFDLDIKAGISHAFDHYSIMERKVESGELAWRENPFSEFVSVADRDMRDTFCVSAKGLPAYETIKYDGGVRLYIELLRSCGSVGSPAGANYPAPDLQSLGAYTFEYAIFPGCGAPDMCLEQAANYRRGLLAESGKIQSGVLPGSASFISLEYADCGGGAKPYISCLKKSETGDEIILRLWNPGQTRPIKLSGLINFREIWKSTLDEKKTEQVSPDKIILPAQSLTTLVLV